MIGRPFQRGTVHRARRHRAVTAHVRMDDPAAVVRTGMMVVVVDVRHRRGQRGREQTGTSNDGHQPTGHARIVGPQAVVVKDARRHYS